MACNPFNRTGSRKRLLQDGLRKLASVIIVRVSVPLPKFAKPRGTLG
jgi:hypothetical protein